MKELARCFKYLAELSGDPFNADWDLGTLTPVANDHDDKVRRQKIEEIWARAEARFIYLGLLLF
jgi:hypothetical protein